MDIRNAFPSKYVKAADLQGQDVTVAIDRTVLEVIDDDSGDQLPVLYFAGMQKGLVLNRTNANTIASLYGSETDDWHGRQITLYPAETDYKGERVGCVRVRSHRPAAPAGHTEQPPQPVTPSPEPVTPSPEPVTPSPEPVTPSPGGSGVSF